MGNIDVNVKQKDGKETLTLELKRRLCKIQVYSRKMFFEEIEKGHFVIDGELPEIHEGVRAIVIITYGDEKPSSNSIKFMKNKQEYLGSCIQG